MNPKICEGPSSSNEDRNANLNDEIHISKGAIPKTKNYLKNTQNGKKTTKLNNNFEGVSPTNYDPSSTNLCKNGYSKTITNSLVSNGVEAHKSLIGWEIKEPNVVENSLIHFNNDSDSSSSEDDSVSEDGCIYTYKADSIPNLPDMLNNLDIPLFDNEPNQARENTSSPEMDFLEMDFEPEPTNEAEIEQTVTIPSELTTENHSDLEVPDEQPTTSKVSSELVLNENVVNEEVSLNCENTQNLDKKVKKKARKEIRMPWSCAIEQRTRASKQLRIIKTDASSSEDCLVNGGEEIEDGKVMIWSHEEAYVKQITQIGPLSCSATAVLNVLIALRLPVPSLDVICNCEKHEKTSELLAYLQAKTTEGSGHREIISGLHKASNGRVYARFFSMYPERLVNIYDWLGFWIKNGAIPVATLNFQKSQHPVPDSWCHQMIYGVDPKNVYLTNPLESVDSGVLWHQLVSEPVLLVKSEKILGKFDVRKDLSELRAFEDRSYDELNVLGQVARVIRESLRKKRENSETTSHIKIPTIFRSGITLAIYKSSEAYPLLLECPELPLLNVNTSKQ